MGQGSSGVATRFTDRLVRGPSPQSDGGLNCDGDVYWLPNVVGMAHNDEPRGTLTGLNVTYLQRWASAWGDLHAADMALFERRELDDSKAANLYLRRALWESAIASCGRCGFSNKKRKIPLTGCLDRDRRGRRAAVHERLMDWRHNHVAHRDRAELESVEAVLTYARGHGAPDVPQSGAEHRGGSTEWGRFCDRP
jgi:hypothetical protein